MLRQSLTYDVKAFCAGGKVAVVIVRVSGGLPLFAQCGLEMRPLKALSAPIAKTDLPRISSFVTDGITSCSMRIGHCGRIPSLLAT